MSSSAKLILVLTAIVAAGTMAASTASATTAIGVEDEPSGAPCNPCVVTATGESHLNAFGIRVSTCTDTFTAEIYYDGTGHMGYSNGAHDSGGTCTRRACNGVGEDPAEGEFDLQGTEETAAGSGEMNIRFCLDASSNPNGTGTHCNATVGFTEGSNHSYALGLHPTCAGGVIEVEGQYLISGGDDIEIAPPATSTIEFDHEGSGTNCNPCAMTVIGESHVNAFGTPVSSCLETNEWELFHNGNGHLDYSGGSHSGGGTCTRIACNGIGERVQESQFDTFASQETGPGTATMQYRFCLDTTGNPNGTGMHCVVPIEMTELGANHSRAFVVHGQCASGLVEFEASWIRTDGDIEVGHI